MDQDAHIRKAASTDLVRLVALISQLSPQPYWRGLLTDSIRCGWTWIAEADGTVAGFLAMTDRFFGRPFIDLLVVEPDHRRKGYAAALMAMAETQAVGDRVFVSTNRSNAPMRSLLAARGYVDSGVVHNLDPDDPELILVRFKPLA